MEQIKRWLVVVDFGPCMVLIVRGGLFRGSRPSEVTIFTFFIAATMIKYVLLVNKQGQTRMARYFVDIDAKERLALEGEIVRRCLARGPTQVRCRSIGKPDVARSFPALPTPRLDSLLRRVRDALITHLDES